MRRMKLLIVVLFVLILNLSLYSQTVPQKALESITSQELKDHVYFLASDAMKGRDTPSAELDSCALYISKEFSACNLQPPDADKNYFQEFNTFRRKLSEPNSFILSLQDESRGYKIKRDFIPSYLTANDIVSDVDIVFAGYGITAPEYKYDDYRNIDVKGKAVLIFKGEPQKSDTTSIFNGSRNTDHSKIRVKIENAKDHGAVCVILVSDPISIFRRPPNYWPSLMRNPLENAVPLTFEEKPGEKIVTVVIGKKLAGDIMKNSNKSLEELYKKIDKTLQPQSLLIEDKKVTIETNLKGEKYPTQNVVGYLKGSDPELCEEFIVIGAHYDHIGVNDTIVYNGADDNASGTAGVIEIAEAFTVCKIAPKRSILFITFAGEEKGLFGSRYYTSNPIFPLEKTVAMLNLDMISRNDTNEVAIIGSSTSSCLKKINEAANKNIGMDLAYDQDNYFKNSDHYSFYRKDIPVLFYNSKSTPDLHKPTDDPEKIISEKMAKISKLIFSTAWLIANRTERPDFTEFK